MPATKLQGLEVAFKDCETRGKYFQVRRLLRSRDRSHACLNTIGLSKHNRFLSAPQSILLSLVPTPALVSLHTTLLEEHTSLSSFSPDKPIPKANDYFPHLSLVYSNLSSSEAQAKIDELKKLGVIVPSPSSPPASSIHGTSSPSDDQGGVTITQPAKSATTSEGASDAGERPRLSRLTLDRVQLWDCTGPVQGWKMVKQVDLADL